MNLFFETNHESNHKPSWKPNAGLAQPFPEECQDTAKSTERLHTPIVVVPWLASWMLALQGPIITIKSSAIKSNPTSWNQ